ncbi:GTP-binding protein [Actinospica acidithermotolerans]|nr:ATP/GTP-binding protein [Actinospica acidithermotolerans]
MAFNGSDPFGGVRTGVRELEPTATVALKIAIVGPLGVGKSTMVRSVSEISPLTTEETMSRRSVPVDALGPSSAKTETTVAMDFGRITVSDRVVLYLFGTPGQERFWFLWDGLVEGALGAVVIVDVLRLAESFDVLERLERRGCAFIVAANRFPGAPVYRPEELREALDLPTTVPVVDFDARERESCRDVLISLARYLLAASRAPRVVR